MWTIIPKLKLIQRECLPNNSQNKQKFRLSEQGMSIIDGNGERGDLIVVVNAVIPDLMSEKQKQHIISYKGLKTEG